MKKRKTSKALNTSHEVVKRIAFDFTHDELLTPTLIYIWNAEVDELEKLFDEVLGRLPFEYLERYLASHDVPRFEIKPSELFMTSNRSLDAAFRELCHRADHDDLRQMECYIQLLLEAPCKSDECQESCDDYYRSANNAC